MPRTYPPNPKPHTGVIAVAAAGVLYAFSSALDALPKRTVFVAGFDVNHLLGAIFRIN